jgi:hypothetical protein
MGTWLNRTLERTPTVRWSVRYRTLERTPVPLYSYSLSDSQNRIIEGESNVPHMHTPTQKIIAINASKDGLSTGGGVDALDANRKETGAGNNLECV